MKLVDLFEEFRLCEGYPVDFTKWNGNPEDFKKVKAFIEKECAQFIKESEGLPVFRGMNTTALVSVFDRRRDREPRDSSVELHRMIDKFLFEKFKWHCRNDGVFATGHDEMTVQYGTPHVMIPIGDFSYVWSRKTKDVFEYFFNLSPEKESAGEEELVAAFLPEMSKLDYTDEDLVGAIEYGHEIMFDCHKYFMVDAHLWYKLFDDEEDDDENFR